MFVLLISSWAAAQAKAPAATVDNDFVHQQFSSTCNLEPQWAPLTADLNADGVEDLVVVAR